MHTLPRRPLAGALALAILAAIPAGAQQPGTLADAPAYSSSGAATPADAAPIAAAPAAGIAAAPAAPAAATPAPGPTVEQATVAVRAPAQALEPQVAAASRAGLGTARAQMIVGFAALVAGAIVGGTPGTIIMITGAAIGLWGLYNYLQ